ncbi:MAG: type II toxin-antitoxin system RelE/ParE family toxin [Eubacteriales bacterium]|jgi:mRNA interferase RelE/StbE|nr:type II toxin-antitoxin system RelE/ParE family toxin [uncultured Ruminococcus sp.]MDO4892473.1 type II toxin-antitoxin system RelE/ParE family toxin [Eubacteriales bacterium]
MKYRIEINKKAQKFIKSQPRNQQERLLAAIYKLPEGDVKALAGLKDVYRLRVGDYRVIYEIRNDILLITVVNVGNRGQVYYRI